MAVPWGVWDMLIVLKNLTELPELLSHLLWEKWPTAPAEVAALRPPRHLLHQASLPKRLGSFVATG